MRHRHLLPQILRGYYTYSIRQCMFVCVRERMRGCCKTQILVLRLAFAGAFSSPAKSHRLSPSATLLQLWDPAGTLPGGEVYSKTNSRPVNNFN
jgi:hypothetical protein